MAEKTKQEVSKDHTFSLYDLRKNSKKLFKVNPEIVDGAFRNVKQKNLTKKQAQELINIFLKKEVK